MNERLGKTGNQEAVSIAATALSVCGIFTYETKQLYESGNSTYLTLPTAAFISLGIFLLTASAMEKTNSKHLFELLKKAFKRFSPIASAALVLMLVFSAYAPISRFIAAMHSLFYDGASYERIALFIMPTVFFMVVMGFETMARCAKIFVVPLVGMLLISVIGSIGEFRTYRLYPLLGNPMNDIITQMMRETGTFLPALLSLLTVADGLNGTASAKRAGLIAALIAAVICFIAQMALALVYTYSELQEIFMPLFRVNYLNKYEAHLMRMDKTAHIMWLNGSMIAGAFYIYCAARLICQSFSMKDIRPASAAVSMAVLLMILIETQTNDRELFARFKNAIIRFGWLIIAAVPLLCIVFARAGEQNERGRKKNEAV